MWIASQTLLNLDLLCLGRRRSVGIPRSAEPVMAKAGAGACHNLPQHHSKAVDIHLCRDCVLGASALQITAYDRCAELELTFCAASIRLCQLGLHE